MYSGSEDCEQMAFWYYRREVKIWLPTSLKLTTHTQSLFKSPWWAKPLTSFRTSVLVSPAETKRVGSLPSMYNCWRSVLLCIRHPEKTIYRFLLVNFIIMEGPRNDVHLCNRDMLLERNRWRGNRWRQVTADGIDEGLWECSLTPGTRTISILTAVPSVATNLGWLLAGRIAIDGRVANSAL